MALKGVLLVPLIIQLLLLPREKIRLSVQRKYQFMKGLTSSSKEQTVAFCGQLISSDVICPHKGSLLLGLR